MNDVPGIHVERVTGWLEANVAGARGPFAFEHEAMRDGCATCHNPHGTVNAKMLTSRNANLCLKCHVQDANSSVLVGGMPHSVFLRTGTCWTAGCHEAVHGSQINSTLRY